MCVGVHVCACIGVGYARAYAVSCLYMYTYIETFYRHISDLILKIPQTMKAIMDEKVEVAGN